MNYFVAVRIPAPAGLDAALEGAPVELRRFHPDDLHATVAFLGRMDHALAPAVLDAMDRIDFEADDVRFARLVALPSRRRPSAISFELAGPGRPALIDLIARERQGLVELARGRQDDRPPYPHVTVARPPRRTPADLRRRILGWVDGVTPPEGTVVARELVLFRSNRRDGRLFEAVDRELLRQLD